MQLPERAREVIEKLDHTRGLYYNVGRPTAELLDVFARILRPKRIIEIGAANGYSAIILGEAVRGSGGSVITIERNGRFAEEAQKNIIDAGLQDVVTVYPGSAYRILDRLPGPFDLVFLDATKQEYLGYYERVRDKMSENGLLLADNVISHEDELRNFISVIGRDEKFTSTILYSCGGLLVSTVKTAYERSAKKQLVGMGELVREAGPRIFQGTVADIKTGRIFLKNLYDKTKDDKHLNDMVFNEMDGYEKALFEDEQNLPN